jgi:short subunit dehydrogenase-like uncharacterized protein
MTSPSTRPWDITLLGATGFVGRLIAAYLARVAPATVRLRLAGRDRDKLERLSRELRRDVGVVVADVADAAALARVASETGLTSATASPSRARASSTAPTTSTSPASPPTSTT